jgi:mycothiol system anti-sigma-R factor
MICGDVKRVVYFFLDGSLGKNKQSDFKSHLELCPDCATRTKVHSRLRAFIARRLRPESAPARLKQRLVRAFRAVNADWS